MSQECKQSDFNFHKCTTHHKNLIVCKTGLQERINKERKEAIREALLQLLVIYGDEFYDAINQFKRDRKVLTLSTDQMIFVVIKQLRCRAGLDETDAPTEEKGEE